MIGFRPRANLSKIEQLHSQINSGAVVLVDWRDKHYSSEPGRTRPAIVVVNSVLLANLRVLTVVPLTGDVNLAPPSLSIRIDPNGRNGLKKPSYALAWNIQTVAVERTTTTNAVVTGAEVNAIRRLIVEYLTTTLEDQ
jgi:mRNA-degrading endonuclease toxin of MazEF toxin-antitoxin module